MYLYVMNKARIKCFLEYCLIVIYCDVAILLCVYLINCAAAEGNAFLASRAVRVCSSKVMITSVMFR